MNKPVVLITGALTGIGRATAIAFSREGARIVVSGRRDEESKTLAAEIRKLGTEVEFVRSDVRHEEDVRSLVDKTVERFGRLDVAVNAAGTEGVPGPVSDQTPESYAATFDTNVLGTLLSVKHELRVMLAQGFGSYGNESSLMIATRPPGHHTKPHMHVSEQINHVMEGEIWFFVEDQGYLCKKGDFQRIPANKVHWAWNRSSADAVVVESHSPPLVGGEIIKGAAGLFDDEEKPNLRGPGANQFVPYDQEAVERKVFSS